MVAITAKDIGKKIKGFSSNILIRIRGENAINKIIDRDINRIFSLLTQEW
jgi:hypothetical protein